MWSIMKAKYHDVVMLIIKRAALALLAILLIYSVVHFYTAAIQVREAGFIDTPTFIAQAGFFMDSGKLYSNPLKEGGELDGFEPSAPWYKFPPAYLLAYMPWAPAIDLDYERYGKTLNALSRDIWAVHVIRYLLSLSVILVLLNSKKSKYFLLNGMVMGLLFTPVFESLYGLIFDNLLLFSLAIILLLNKSGKNELAGVVIGTLSMFKLYPAILILWAIAVKNLKMVAYFIAACFLLLLVSLSVFGLDNHLFFYTRLLPVLLNETSVADTGNFSLGSLFVQHWENKHIAMWYFGVFKTLILAATAAVLWVHGRHDDGCVRYAAIKLSLIVCAMLLYLPNYWGNYQLILILPVLTLLAGAYADYRGSFWQGVVAVMCWFVMVLSKDGGGVFVPFGLWKYLHWSSDWVNFRVYIPLVLWLATALALVTHLRGFIKKSSK